VGDYLIPQWSRGHRIHDQGAEDLSFRQGACWGGQAPGGYVDGEQPASGFTDEENLVLIDVLNKAEKVVKMLAARASRKCRTNKPDRRVKLEKRKRRKIRVRR
jgi:hypothetical protein